MPNIRNSPVFRKKGILSEYKEDDRRSALSLSDLFNYQNGKRPTFNIYGGGGLENTEYGNILSGGVGAESSIPLSEFINLMIEMGGGGAYGNLDLPDRKLKIREFDPYFGAGINYRW